MRKIIIIVLIVVAVPLYTYNMYMLLRGSLSKYFDKKGSVTFATDTSNDLQSLIFIATPAHFEKKGRSPFLPYPVSDKPVTTIQKQKNPILPKETPKAPSISINGIMWNPQNPIAMVTMPDGSSATVKVGQVINELTIKKIEKTFIVVISGKKEFQINR